jgi:hypothetical protein
MHRHFDASLATHPMGRQGTTYDTKIKGTGLPFSGFRNSVRIVNAGASQRNRPIRSGLPPLRGFLLSQHGSWISSGIFFLFPPGGTDLYRRNARSLTFRLSCRFSPVGSIGKSPIASLTVVHRFNCNSEASDSCVGVGIWGAPSLLPITIARCRFWGTP